MNETMITSVSPHLRSTRTTQKVMLDVIIALIPALIASVVFFGWRSLLLTCVSVAACVLCEYLWEKLRHIEVTVGDLSAVVTGILLAYNVPVGMPLWELVVGDIEARMEVLDSEIVIVVSLVVLHLRVLHKLDLRENLG